MVVNNLDVIGVTIAPSKADAPAVIDPHAIWSRSIPCQLLQTISRGNLQIIEGVRIAEQAQFPQGHLLEIRRQPAGALAGENLLRLTILE